MSTATLKKGKKEVKKEDASVSEVSTQETQTTVYRDPYSKKPYSTQEAYIEMKMKRNTKYSRLRTVLYGLIVEQKVAEATINIPKATGDRYVDARLPAHLLKGIPGGASYYVRKINAPAILKDGNSGGTTNGAVVEFTIEKGKPEEVTEA